MEGSRMSVAGAAIGSIDQHVSVERNLVIKLIAIELSPAQIPTLLQALTGTLKRSLLFSGQSALARGLRRYDACDGLAAAGDENLRAGSTSRRYQRTADWALLPKQTSA
jgi:hypothetical protein